MRLPMHLVGKYSTTFASGFQTMTQTASALAYEFLKPQFTPRAPMGCLQYFTQPSGIIESFNFGQYLNNMDYSICIQKQPDTCRVVFTSSDYDWSLNGVGVAASSSGVGDQDCARDYLMIPGASRTGDGFTYDRYCGGRLHYYRGQSLSSPVVMKTSGPIVLRFHSDGQYEGLNNGGFRLQYDQSGQDCIYHTAEEAGSLASQQILASTLADSRPLSQQNIALGAEQPLLYASQQLSVQQQIQQQDYQDRPTINNNTLPQLGSSFQIQEQQQQQLQLNSIKRNDNFQDDWPATLAQQQQLKPMPTKSLYSSGERDRNRTTSNNLLLLADLSKAFQLISARRSTAPLAARTMRLVN